MSLPEYVVPVISIAGPVALVFVILRCFPHVARAVVVLLAGIAAIVTTSKERREASIRVLDVLSRQGETPPGEKTGTSSGEIRQAPRQGLPRPWRKAHP